MLVRSISTFQYEVDMEKLLTRRLNQTDYSFAVAAEEENTYHIACETDTEDTFEALCAAISLLLVRDLRHFELARIVNQCSSTLAEKQVILTEAGKLAYANEQLHTVTHRLKEYFSREYQLNLEGFMRFRMDDVLSTWQLCVEQAMEELQLQEEYMELMSILHGFVQLQPPRISELSLCLKADGSCSLMDEDTRIDYNTYTDDYLVSMLIGLSPERLTIYDLTGQPASELTDTLSRIFAGRVQLYR